MVYIGYHSLRPRDDLREAKLECASANETVASCYPTEHTIFVQDQFATFVCGFGPITVVESCPFPFILAGNPTLPGFTKDDQLTIGVYAILPDSSLEILRFEGVNPHGQDGEAGSFLAVVNDTWWGDKGPMWVKNITYPFLWKIFGADGPDAITGGQQPVFSAIQTTLPHSILAATASSHKQTQTPNTAGGATTPGPTVRPSGQIHSTSRTAVIGGIVGSVMGGLLLLGFVIVLLYRRRRARRPPGNSRPDPLFYRVMYQQQPSSKTALNHEMRTAHKQLQELQHELQDQPRTRGEAQVSTTENAQLRAQIQALTNEVERLRLMGADAPPAYSG